MTTATIEEAVADAQAETTGNKPVKVFRHRNISASVFANPKKDGGEFLSVTLQRAYKVGNEYRHTSSFTRDEIPVARHLAHQAWQFILETESEPRE